MPCTLKVISHAHCLLWPLRMDTLGPGHWGSGPCQGQERDADLPASPGQSTTVLRHHRKSGAAPSMAFLISEKDHQSKAKAVARVGSSPSQSRGPAGHSSTSVVLRKGTVCPVCSYETTAPSDRHHSLSHWATLTRCLLLGQLCPLTPQNRLASNSSPWLWSNPPG